MALWVRNPGDYFPVTLSIRFMRMMLRCLPPGSRSASKQSPAISLIFPMQIFVSYGRAASPITGAIIAVAGMAGYSPFQVAKRTCIPMGIAVVLTYIYYYIVF